MSSVRVLLKRKLSRWSNLTTRTYYSYASEPFHPLPRLPTKLTAEEAVKAVKSGDTVFVHSAAATPTKLLDALSKYGMESQLRNVTVCHIHIEGKQDHLKPEYAGKTIDLQV